MSRHACVEALVPFLQYLRAAASDSSSPDSCWPQREAALTHLTLNLRETASSCVSLARQAGITEQIHNLWSTLSGARIPRARIPGCMGPDSRGGRSDSASSFGPASAEQGSKGRSVTKFQRLLRHTSMTIDMPFSAPWHLPVIITHQSPSPIHP
jgi:hypothetical protein